jgi:amino acid permease
MVWGVSLCPLLTWSEPLLRCLQWAVASFFIIVVGMSIAELASAAPTSGGVSTPMTSFDPSCWSDLRSAPTAKTELTYVTCCHVTPALFLDALILFPEMA